MRENHRFQPTLTEPWLDLPHAKELKAISGLLDQLEDAGLEVPARLRFPGVVVEEEALAHELVAAAFTDLGGDHAERYARTPADDDHPLGHGNAENLAGLLIRWRESYTLGIGHAPSPHTQQAGELSAGVAVCSFTDQDRRAHVDLMWAASP